MKKIIIQIAKLFVNHAAVLPAIDSVALMGKVIQFTSLDIFVTIPYITGVKAFIDISQFIAAQETLKDPSFKIDKSMKVSMSEGKQVIRVPGYDLGNFPKIHDGDFKFIGAIYEKELPVLKNSLTFISNDDLRPSMTYTYVHDHIVATDAHRLMFVKLEEPLKEPVFIDRKVTKVMDLVGGDWKIEVTPKVKSTTLEYYESRFMRLTNSSGISIVARQDDLKYPQWEIVVPPIEDTPYVVLDKKEVLSIIKTGKKFGNRALNQVVFNLGGASSQLEFADADYSTSYTSDLSSLVDPKKAITIAFNWDFVTDILNLSGNEVKMYYWKSSKAVVFDKTFLLMPLMMNS